MRAFLFATLAGGLLLTACSEPDDRAANDDGAPEASGGVTAPGAFPADGPVGDRVEYYVTHLRSQLPMPINNSTVMDGVRRNGLEIELHYDVIDTSVTRAQLQAWLADTAPPNTCDNAMTAQMVRDGASFRYTYSGGSLSRPVSQTVTRC